MSDVPAAAAPENAAGIKNDNLVKCLVASAVAGWQLYAMARNMIDAIPTYSTEEKKAFFAEVAKTSISDDKGQMIPFKPLDTIEVLNNIVMPFWLAKVAAEKEVEAYRKKAEAAVGEDNTPDNPTKPAIVIP